MSLYLGTTEITKLRDLAPQTGLDITGLWVGSTNVYTVWETYEGTLPATLNANGDNMRQYRIYGNTGGVGDVTENRLDYGTVEDGYSLSQSSGKPISSSGRAATTTPIDVSELENVTLYFTATSTAGKRAMYSVLDANDSLLERITNVYFGTTVINLPSGAAKMYISWYMTSGGLTKDDIKNAMLTPGSTPPASFVPFGYEVDIGVKSGNIFDKSSAVVYNAYINTGDIWTSSANAKSIKIRVKPSTTYTISTFKVLSIFRIAESDDENVEPSNSPIVTGVIRLTNAANSTFTTTANAKALIFQGENNDYQDLINSLMIKEGSVIPTKYQPYFNTTTLLYIGDEQLDKDEYIDCRAGKIYRMIDGTLTPTDPPVALPALPTCEGETIIDYVGQSVAPEKVLLKYRKEGF